MALTAGVLSQVAVFPTSVQVNSTPASGGTGPYTQQYYISTVSGFTPGGGNIVAGATTLAATLSGLIPNTSYFVKMVYTDVGASATITSAQLAISTIASTLSQNQFLQSSYLGTLDQAFNYNTTSAMIDVSQSGLIYAGCAVKLVPSSGTGNSVPKLIACSADSDQVWGFINYDIKTIAYAPGAACQISQAGNVMYLYSTGAITQGLQVTLDITTQGGVAQAVASSGNRIVGVALDGAAAAGQLIRVKLSVPSFLVA